MSTLYSLQELIILVPLMILDQPFSGLFFTYLGLYLMNGHGQPALLYLVPCTLGNKVLLSFFFLLDHIPNLKFTAFVLIYMQVLLLFWVWSEVRLVYFGIMEQKLLENLKGFSIIWWWGGHFFIILTSFYCIPNTWCTYEKCISIIWSALNGSKFIYSFF